MKSWNCDMYDSILCRAINNNHNGIGIIWGFRIHVEYEKVKVCQKSLNKLA